MPMLPDKTTKCHRTGFAETCFKCVTEHGCRLWKHVTLEFDPETGAKGQKGHYDCLDSLVDIYWKDMLRRQLQTTATVDDLRKEVHEANDVQMVGAISHINNRMSALSANGAALEDLSATKLLETSA